MTPVQMRSFHAVAKTGSFSKAAVTLHVSQPTVTTQVRLLEETYGVELFSRRPGQGVQLSETGKALFSITQLAFATIEEAVNLLKETSGLRAGRLRVAAVGPGQVAKIVAAFHRRYPQVDLAVTFGNSKEVEDALLGYRADVGLLGEFREFDRFHVARYSEPEIVVLAGRGHPWSKRREIKIAELAGQPMIMREPGSETRRVLERAARKAAIALRPVMEIGSREGLMAAVADGIGLGAASEEELPPESELTPLRVRDADMFTHIDIACLLERRSARLHRAFFEAAAEVRSGV